MKMVNGIYRGMESVTPADLIITFTEVTQKEGNMDETTEGRKEGKKEKWKKIRGYH